MHRNRPRGRDGLGAFTGLDAKPTRRRVRPVHIVLIVIAALVIFGVGLYLILSSALGPIVDKGDAFMRALKSGDDQAAYAIATPNLQRELEDENALTGMFAKRRPTGWSWSQRLNRNGVGSLIGTAEYQGQETGSVELELRSIDGDWRIDRFELE